MAAVAVLAACGGGGGLSEAQDQECREDVLQVLGTAVDEGLAGRTDPAIELALELDADWNSTSLRSMLAVPDALDPDTGRLPNEAAAQPWWSEACRTFLGRKG
ncbi:MAG: hypothetical protein AAGA99_12175 [Actinomycetota bacterium]